MIAFPLQSSSIFSPAHGVGSIARVVDEHAPAGKWFVTTCESFKISRRLQSVSPRCFSNDLVAQAATPARGRIMH